MKMSDRLQRAFQRMADAGRWGDAADMIGRWQRWYAAYKARQGR